MVVRERDRRAQGIVRGDHPAFAEVRISAQSRGRSLAASKKSRTTPASGCGPAIPTAHMALGEITPRQPAGHGRLALLPAPIQNGGLLSLPKSACLGEVLLDFLCDTACPGKPALLFRGSIPAATRQRQASECHSEQAEGCGFGNRRGCTARAGDLVHGQAVVSVWGWWQGAKARPTVCNPEKQVCCSSRYVKGLGAPGPVAGQAVTDEEGLIQERRERGKADSGR